MNRLEILKASLIKKQKKFDDKLSEHFSEVKNANGQPLNDKRNGVSTMRRWDKQNDSLTTLDVSIEKTKAAIERETSKQGYIERTKNGMPKEITNLIESGTLKQWGKYPYIMFVEGVDKARIIWDDKKKVVMHKFTNTLTDNEQRKKFAQVYNRLFNIINAQQNQYERPGFNN